MRSIDKNTFSAATATVATGSSQPGICAKRETPANGMKFQKLKVPGSHDYPQRLCMKTPVRHNCNCREVQLPRRQQFYFLILQYPVVQSEFFHGPVEVFIWSKPNFYRTACIRFNIHPRRNFCCINHFAINV